MPSKKIKTLKSLKANLKKTLPQKISEVIESYENFAEQPAPQKISEVIESYENFAEQPAPVDAKGFSAHHSACKSAVVHAETLLKLARWTEDEPMSLPQNDNFDISSILEEAHEQEQDEDDES